MSLEITQNKEQVTNRESDLVLEPYTVILSSPYTHTSLYT